MTELTQFGNFVQMTNSLWSGAIRIFISKVLQFTVFVKPVNIHSHGIDIYFEYGHPGFKFVLADLDFWGGFVEHPSRTQAGRQSVTQYITKIVIILVTPKAAAKHEILFNKPASDFTD